MDIHLKASRYLLMLRVCVFALAISATLASDLQNILKILLCAGACMQLMAWLSVGDPVCTIYVSGGQRCDEQNRDHKIVLQLLSERRIELTLEKYYCLWWIQIMYLSSQRRSSVVLILPDTCAADERRFLRQVLNRRQ